MLVYLYLMLFVCSYSYSMTFYTEHAHKRFSKGTITLKLSKQLYSFFAARLQEFDRIEQTTYDVESQTATCFFNDVVDRRALENNASFVNFLRTDSKPRRGHMHRLFFVLNAFAKLQQILNETAIFQFAPQNQGIMRNSAFQLMPIRAPEIIEYFESIEYTLHACAYLARIPVLRYR